jgi:hypothetical protein
MLFLRNTLLQLSYLNYEGAAACKLLNIAHSADNVEDKAFFIRGSQGSDLGKGLFPKFDQNVISAIVTHF